MKICTTLALLSFAGSLASRAALTDNLIAYWDFEGNTSNNAAAVGGSAYDGVLMGDATVTGGTVKVGAGSLVLDGAGDYLDVTSIINPNLPWSVSAWYRADLAPSGARMMVFETSGAFPMSFGLREAASTTNTNHQTFVDVTPATDPQGTFDIPDAATAATWHHVTLTCIPPTPTSAGTVRAYIDGTLRNTLNIAAGNTLAIANGFHIGTYRNADDRWFGGAIDEVAVWNRTLSQPEVQDINLRGNLGESLVLTKYAVALTGSPPSGGTVSGSGSYATGAAVPVAATPNPGYVFTSWDGTFTGQPGSFTYTASADATATATFGEDTADTDNDGLSNYQEIVTYGTLPNNPDSDGDEIPDGAEILIGTAPITSDAALVSFVRNNLSAGNAGAIALSTPRITRDPDTGAITLSLGLSSSADQSIWQAVDLGDPSVSIIPSGNGWTVTVPAPSGSVNSYILLGEQP